MCGGPKLTAVFKRPFGEGLRPGLELSQFLKDGEEDGEEEMQDIMSC